MPFIGNQPAEKYSSFQKQDFTTSATTSYTLDHPVANGNEIALFINFVRQEPTAAYTASGTSLTLTSATSSSDDMYCVYLGKAVQTVNPPNSSVGSSQVSADLITGQTALGATPADTDELLISDAGTLKRVDFSHLKVDNTPAFRATSASGNTVPTGTYTKLTFDTEAFDTNSNFASSRFTPTVAGKYVITAQTRLNTSDDFNDNIIAIYKNGSISSSNQTSHFHFECNRVTGIIDMNGSSDYVEIFLFHNRGSDAGTDGGTTLNFFEGYKLIGV